MAIRNNFTGRWNRGNRRYHSHNRHQYNNGNNVGICAVIITGLIYLIQAPPAIADDGVSVSAQPRTSVTGSVANQAVQINQGSLSTQSFSRGHFCNGPVISVAPYYLHTESETGSSSLSRNFGGQVSLSMPLDGGTVETCKALARKQLQKQTLDYELVRIRECMSIMERGFMIRSESPFSVICSDVVPIPLASAEPMLEEAPAPVRLPVFSEEF